MSWRDIVKIEMEKEKLAWGSLVECPKCGAKLGNKRALDRHTQEKHSGSNRRSAYTAGD
jgi:hypothetical protein